MKNKDYKEYNAQPVLERLEQMIDRGFSRDIRQVYDELSIFDWWKDRLSVSQMKQMRTFLKEAIKLGYTGYVCFKVGASGCSNGMWAHKKETTTGYSPDGDALYRSFTPDYTYYSFQKDGVWYPKEGDPNNGNMKYDSLKTIKMLEEALANA